MSDVRAWSPSTLRTSTLVEHASFPQWLPSAQVIAWRQARPVVASVDSRTLLVDDLPVALPYSVRQTPDGLPQAALSDRGALGQRRRARTRLASRGSRPTAAAPMVRGPIGSAGLVGRRRRDPAGDGHAGRRIGLSARRFVARDRAASGGTPRAARVAPRVHARRRRSGLDVGGRTSVAGRIARVDTPADETAPALSPDETLMAWQSNASGQWQIALARVADSDAQLRSSPAEPRRPGRGTATRCGSSRAMRSWPAPSTAAPRRASPPAKSLTASRGSWAPRQMAECWSSRAPLVHHARRRAGMGRGGPARTQPRAPIPAVVPLRAPSLSPADTGDQKGKRITGGQEIRSPFLTYLFRFSWSPDLL